MSLAARSAIQMHLRPSRSQWACGTSGTSRSGAKTALLTLAVLTACSAAAPLQAGDGKAGDAPLVACVYPRNPRPPAPLGAPEPVHVVQEVESNNAPASAQPLPLGPVAFLGQHRFIDVDASFSNSGDIDYFRVGLRRGDVLGLTSVRVETRPSKLAIHDLNGTLLVEAGRQFDVAGTYPETSPLPVGHDPNDDVLSWVVPEDGDYLIYADNSFGGCCNQAYRLEFRLFRPGLQMQSPPARQVIFIDFNGATINAAAIFGEGHTSATLSPLSAYLPRWGLSASQQNAVIDAILATVYENFNDLRTSALNGDRDADNLAGHFSVEFRNSRDHPDPWGQPNTSRVIVGGSIEQLGINTIGIADSVDPGNFATSETAVVLLDALSAGPDDLNSINSIPRAAGTSIIDAIGLVVGYVICHEAGHFLGNWHVDNSNEVFTIMDRGGVPSSRRAGVGPDGILGTADDVDIDFGSDAFQPGEFIAAGLQHTHVRTAFALSTGNETIHVDAANTTGIEHGSSLRPYRTVTPGHAAARPGRPLILQGGVYPETILFDKPIDLQTQGGLVIIGP